MKCCFLPVLFILTSLLSNPISGQSLLESRQSSYFTYIYKITDQEARGLYLEGSADEESALFHTLVDSFPTDSSYTKKLPVGLRPCKDAVKPLPWNNPKGCPGSTVKVSTPSLAPGVRESILK